MVRGQKHLEHQGDFKAAAKQLASDGHGVALMPGVGFHLTDLGNAERLVAQHGSDLRYFPPWKSWLVWDGMRWARDATRKVMRLAYRTARSIYDEAAEEPDEDRRKALAKWAVKSEAHERLKAIVTLAESLAGIPVLPRGLDVDPTC